MPCCRRESAVYVSVVSARAELLRFAIVHGHNDVHARYDRFHRLLSASLIIELCKAWSDLRGREIDDEAAEMEAAMGVES